MSCPECGSTKTEKLGKINFCVKCRHEWEEEPVPHKIGRYALCANDCGNNADISKDEICRDCKAKIQNYIKGRYKELPVPFNLIPMRFRLEVRKEQIRRGKLDHQTG